MDNMVTKDLASNIKFNNVNITDRFFGYYQNLIINEVIPYQWKVLNDELEDVEKSSAIKNFKIAAKEMKYLDLAKFFIDERGQSPHFFELEWEARGKTSYWNGWNPCESPNASKDFISCIGAEYNQTH